MSSYVKFIASSLLVLCITAEPHAFPVRDDALPDAIMNKVGYYDGVLIFCNNRFYDRDLAEEAIFRAFPTRLDELKSMYKLGLDQAQAKYQYDDPSPDICSTSEYQRTILGLKIKSLFDR